MTINYSFLLLVSGLVIGMVVLYQLRKRVSNEEYKPTGIFNIGFSIAAVLPGLLIKLDIIEQTALTVTLAILYFFIFIVGTMLVEPKAMKK